MPARVVVVGAINTDLVIRGVRFPVPGETVVGGVFERHHGGKGGNQAVAASRALRRKPAQPRGRAKAAAAFVERAASLGLSERRGDVVLVGAVGDDPFGREELEALEADGVNISEVAIHPGVATGTALVLVNESGANLIAVAPGANATLKASEVEAALQRHIGPDTVVVASLEVPVDAVVAAGWTARAMGARFVLNPAPSGDIEPGLVRLAHFLTPNDLEIGDLVPDLLDRPVEAAEALVALDNELAVVVTLGKDGALLATQGSTRAVKPLSVTVVDSTGAGDAFNGALAAALAERRPLLEAVSRARTAGGLAVTRPGAREGIPWSDEIDATPEPR